MNISKYGTAFALLSTFAALAGCSGAPTGGADVSGRGEIINQTRSVRDPATITAIGGTYTGCMSHVDGASWTVSGADGTHLTEGDLTVVKGDTACTLSMAKITAGNTNYLGAAIPMAGDYAANASAFSAGGATIFYGNAKLNSLTFADNFSMSVLVSDAPSETDAGALAAGWAIWSGSATASTVPASNYTFDLTSGMFALTKNSDNTVDTATGYAQLTAGSDLGEDYAIVTGAPGTFAQVDDAWKGTKISGGLLSSLTTLELPAGSFGLVGTDLTAPGQVRTVIVRHIVSGVSSYQTFTITFTL